MHLVRVCGTLALSALTIVSACGQSSEAANAGTGGDKQGQGGKAGGAAATQPGAGGPAGSGSRGGTVIGLGPNDVLQVARSNIEAATPINGDLKPIEEIVVRARVEGDLIGVFAREGQRVARGDVLARFDNTTQESDRASAAAERDAATSDVTNAKWNYDQSQELFKAGAIPERDLRAAEQTLVAARARLAGAEARLNAASQTDSDTRVVAPTTGIVSLRSVESGEHVARGAPLFTVVRNDILELEAAVPARLSESVTAGQLVRFVAGGRQLEGRVARVSPTINPANRSVTIYIQVPNPNGVLKGNTFATGRVIGRTVRNAIVIPTAALRQSQQLTTPFVYRIIEDVVEHAPVTLGVVDEGLGVAEVVQGLTERDRIIVGNLGALGAGMRVSIISSERGRGRGVTAASRDTTGKNRALQPLPKR
ncbi:MAG: efflux RND transporter periplasmic adaptor subunit [Gemmatimonadaceae bacterium]